jgi:hypothetical protein
MISFDQSVEVSTCSEPILGQGSVTLIPLRQSYGHGERVCGLVARCSVYQ